MDDYFAKCVTNMKNVVENNNLTEWLVTYVPDPNLGFMWSSHKNIDIISVAVAKDGHSGASFACCMRQVQSELKNTYPKAC